MKKINTALSVLLASLLLSGCQTAAVKGSGFLGNYDGFKDRSWSDGAKVYLNQDTDISILKKYDKIMLLPIEVWYSKDSEYQGINPQELTYITSQLENKFKAVFEPQYPIVDTAGKNVLVIRMALTGLQKQSPERGALGYIPIALLISAGKNLANNLQDQEEIFYAASLEAEGYDSVNGDRLIAMVDQRSGDETTVSTGSSGITSLDSTLDYWVKRFRKNWDLAHK